MPAVGQQSITTVTNPIASGGTTGQVLTQAASGTSWTTPTPNSYGAPWLSSTWYDNRLLTGSATASSFRLAASTAYYFPMFVPAAVSITAQAVYVTTASATSNHYFAVYTPASTGLPGTRLARFSLGTGTTVGWQIGQNAMTLPAGWVWLALGNGGSGTAQLAGCLGSQTWAVGQSTPSLYGPTSCCYSETASIGVPANPATTVATNYSRSDGGATGAVTSIVFWMRTA